MDIGEPRIYSLREIDSVLPEIDLVAAMEGAFRAYSRGAAVVGPVGELLLTEPPGEVHLKYGFLADSDFYVVKIASGFYANPDLGIPSGDGQVLVYDRATGVLRAIRLACWRLPP
jgi:ornithine cyclodeaminase